MVGKKLILGTRGSDLALAQARMVKDALERAASTTVELKIIKTVGDKDATTPFGQIESKGFFTKEIEEALLHREIDVAVHSLKDLMTTLPPGLQLGAVGFQADRRELLVLSESAHSGNGLLPIREGAVVGTSSARRQAQIRHHNPHVQLRDIRGNVPTRIEKVRNGEYDAIVVAAAGIERLQLNLSGILTVPLPPRDFLAAPGQGILAIEIRDDDPTTEELVAELTDPSAQIAAALERGLLARFQSGCSLPLGVYSEQNGSALHLSAVLGRQRDGQWQGLVRAESEGDQTESVVDDVYAQLTEKKAES